MEDDMFSELVKNLPNQKVPTVMPQYPIQYAAPNYIPQTYGNAEPAQLMVVMPNRELKAESMLSSLKMKLYFAATILVLCLLLYIYVTWWRQRPEYEGRPLPGVVPIVQELPKPVKRIQLDEPIVPAKAPEVPLPKASEVLPFVKEPIHIYGPIPVWDTTEETTQQQERRMDDNDPEIQRRIKEREQATKELETIMAQTMKEESDKTHVN